MREAGIQGIFKTLLFCYTDRVWSPAGGRSFHYPLMARKADTGGICFTQLQNGVLQWGCKEKEVGHGII